LGGGNHRIGKKKLVPTVAVKGRGERGGRSRLWRGGKKVGGELARGGEKGKGELFITGERGKGGRGEKKKKMYSHEGWGLLG